MAQVIITKAQLQGTQPKACSDYERSPEWDGEQLVYTDWEASRDRLLSTPAGVAQLGYLVKHGLVPMTREEFRAARKAREAAAYDLIGRK